MAKKILIAEDDDAIGGALENKLKNSGFEVQKVSNGQEALERMGENNFDLLILDMMMPKLDGLGVLKEMKQNSFNVPVIVISNLANEDEVNETKKYGVLEYLVKTDISLFDLTNKIMKYLNG